MSIYLFLSFIFLVGFSALCHNETSKRPVREHVMLISQLGFFTSFYFFMYFLYKIV